jgi:hypothetical protein
MQLLIKLKLGRRPKIIKRNCNAKRGDNMKIRFRPIKHSLLYRMASLIMCVAFSGLHGMTVDGREEAFFKSLASYLHRQGASEEELLKKFQLDGGSRRFLEAALTEVCGWDDEGPISFPPSLKLRRVRIVYSEKDRGWKQGRELLARDNFIKKVIKRALAKKFKVQDDEITPILMDPATDDNVASLGGLATQARGDKFTIQHACFGLSTINKKKVLEKFEGLSVGALEDFLNSSEIVVSTPRGETLGTIPQYIRNIVEMSCVRPLGYYEGDYSLFIVYGANKNVPLALMQFKTPEGRDGEYNCNILIKSAVKEPLRQQAIMYSSSQLTRHN